MNMRQRMALVGIALGLALAVAGPAMAGDPSQAQSDSNSVRIGLVGSLFRDASESMVMAIMKPFAAVMENETGKSGELVNAGDALHLGRLLDDGRADLGVFHGIEFAWAQQKYPRVRPLVIAVNRHSHLRAFLMVRRDSKANRLADLKGKTLALPRFTREHCYVFLQHHCGPLARFFSKLTQPTNVEVALDDLADGRVDAVIADGVCLECFRKRKPARFDRLRVLERSEEFPATVIAYRAGTFDEATLRRYRSALLRVSETSLGRQLLTLWQITGFEPVPDDYDQTVADIVKAYPAPGETTRESVLRPPTRD
jgi:ABC-type phosphate/phosphonate transport system substrate-binding protein